MSLVDLSHLDASQAAEIQYLIHAAGITEPRRFVGGEVLSHYRLTAVEMVRGDFGNDDLELAQLLAGLQLNETGIRERAVPMHLGFHDAGAQQPVVGKNIPHEAPACKINRMAAVEVANELVVDGVGHQREVGTDTSDNLVGRGGISHAATRSIPPQRDDSVGRVAEYRIEIRAVDFVANLERELEERKASHFRSFV